MLLTHLIDFSKEEYGEYPFLYYENKVYTNFEVEKFAKKVSVMLREHDIADGERVVVSIPNCPEVIYSYQGILRSRSIVIPVLHLLHPSEIHFILTDSKAKAIFTSSQVLPKFLEAIKGLSYKPLFIVVDQIDDPSLLVEHDMILLHETIDAIDESKEWLKDAHENDVAVILYTSGTTGRPKGVMLTHKNLYSNSKTTYNLSIEKENSTRRTTLGVLPLAHAFGFTVMNSSILLGNSVVIFSKFDVQQLFESIEKHKVSSFAAVPAMIHAMVASPLADTYDLTSLESVASGSASLPIALIQAFKKKFNAEIREGYGLSEATTIVTTSRDGMPVKHGSVGVPIPGVEIRIIDEHGNDLPSGQIGELLVKGDNVTPGYYGLVEETRNTIRDGWLYTGDLVRMDEDGYLYIVDRKKDLVIRGGLNIYPRDVEEVIVKHEAVSEVAVVGLPDEKMGEEIVAYVVTKPGFDVTSEEIILFSQQKLAKYKTPKQVYFVQQLPRNGVGKILKKKLREMYAENSSF
ncbi:long-chain-fatty-acid--CoA ligase [Robertmurraya yapensis]|uniref:Long-chain-fatty-acid--CoA ligase n=1 Tax=Bacillus yapensis TaxID=2492960 RepID=A0A431WEI7_9BACI|nr:long-chain-fatty-acid--CoA ligase [Bacillus yapensis]RTR33952.1 long-chain-fatty-acid--CoA ligase [Bacillus yapensis]TKS97270.1 long-chain fatty acid--CoA ligase [Bacillus yapensis]